MFSLANYQAVTSLLAMEVSLRHKVENPVPEHTFLVQNSVPEHDFCSGVIGGQLTELHHKADTSSPVTCLINTRIYRSSIFSAANSLTTRESEKFGRIQEFLLVRYKLLAGTAGVVWYKV